MSEYMEKISLTEFKASAGYIGYEDTNVLDKIRKPYSVILFDEIEKHILMYLIFSLQC
jgi:ATP-dependent Clp protease ATP-binding subunit ClpA